MDLEKFHRKTAEAENSPLGPRGKKGVRWNMKIFSVQKTFFLVGWKNKMLVGKKTCRLKKKCRLENFPSQKRTCPECPEFPVMQDRKTAEAGKKRPRAYRGRKPEKSSFGEKKIVGLQKIKSVGKEMPSVGHDRA